MTSYRTKEEVEESFDDGFPPIEFCNVGENKMPYVEATRDRIKDFIHSLRLSDLEAIIEGIGNSYDEAMENSKSALGKDLTDKEAFLISTERIRILSYLKSLKQ